MSKQEQQDTNVQEESNQEETKSRKSKNGEVTMFFSDKVFRVMERAVTSAMPVLLVGDTGTGKTSLIRELAKKEGKELIRLNLTGQTGVDEILGKWLADPSRGTYWLDGLLIESMKKGYWIVLDEINMALPEILSALHSLLDDDRKIVLKEKDGEIVRCHDEFRIFATMNPSDEYVGTKDLNKAFLSRFPVVMDVSYSDKESEIIQERSGLLREVAELLVSVAYEIRSVKNKEKLSITCSTRDLIYTASLVAQGLELSDAFEVAILNKAPREERTAISKIFELVTGKDIQVDGYDGKFESVFKLIEKSRGVFKELKEAKHNIVSLTKEKDELNSKLDIALQENSKALKMIDEQSDSMNGLKDKVLGFVSLFEELKGNKKFEELLQMKHDNKQDSQEANQE